YGHDTETYRRKKNSLPKQQKERVEVVGDNTQEAREKGVKHVEDKEVVTPFEVTTTKGGHLGLKTAGDMEQGKSEGNIKVWMTPPNHSK
ncbi:hypothetical protein HAX54_036767, partial [Datura stramonium]|nr:hypothetical protein [Datura stramonium]